MNKNIQLSPNLELRVISAGSLSFGKADKPIRELVRRTYEEVQLAVVPEDKALAPVDSIGWTVERGMLTDRADVQPGYNHLILCEIDEAGNVQPIGLRVTNEAKIKGLGAVLMDLYSGMVPGKYARKQYSVDASLLTDGPRQFQSLTPFEILAMFTRQLTRPPESFAATVSDGVGVSRRALANAGYLHYGPKGRAMLWVPPLNADTPEAYAVAQPAALYIKLGKFSENRLPLDTGVNLAVKEYIKESGTELNPGRLRRMGYNFDTLPSVVKTMKAHSAVANANGGYIPLSPISV